MKAQSRRLGSPVGGGWVLERGVPLVGTFLFWRNSTPAQRRRHFRLLRASERDEVNVFTEGMLRALVASWDANPTRTFTMGRELT